MLKGAPGGSHRSHLIPESQLLFLLERLAMFADAIKRAAAPGCSLPIDVQQAPSYRAGQKII